MNAKFSGHADFTHAEFSGHANFMGAKFSGDANFIGAAFSGGAYFISAAFSGGAYFISAKFSGNADFRSTKFSNAAIFRNLEKVEDIKSFSFRYASFNGSLEISSNEIFPCLIDLTNTKTAHHVSLHGVNCELPRVAGRESKLFSKCDWITHKYDWIIHKTASDKNDVALARRLKELAESNKDHHKAKDFHILEMQAQRKFPKKPPRYLSIPLFKILPKACFKYTYKYLPKFPYAYMLRAEFWFEKLSDYGRSIMLPIWWLLGIIGVFTFRYFSISNSIKDWELLGKSFIYSTSQMLAFIPTSRGARSEMATALFGDPIPDYVYLLNSLQGLLSIILLFLIGLALRNRFRI